MFLKFLRSDGSFHVFHNVSSYVHSGNTFAKCLQHETLPEYFQRHNVPTDDGCDYYHNTNEDIPPKFREVFFGQRYKDERFNMKRVSFTHENTHYAVFTEYAVYACNDDGKTIDKF